MNTYEFGKLDAQENLKILGQDFNEFYKPSEERIEMNYQIYSEQTENPDSYEEYKEDYSTGWNEVIEELLNEFILAKVDEAGLDSDHIDPYYWPLQQKIEFFTNIEKGIEDVRSYIKSL